MRFILALFALILAVVATVILFKAIVPHVNAWHEARNWVQQEASLDSYKLNVTPYKVTNTDGSTYTDYDRSVWVKFSYSINGRDYQGNRLVIDGIDAGDSDINHLRRYLASSSKQNNKINVWVNPNKPSESAVDRRFRWRGFDLLCLFFIGFAVLGYSAIFELFRATYFFIRPRFYSRLRAKAEKQNFSKTTLYDRFIPCACRLGYIFIVMFANCGGLQVSYSESDRW